MRFSSVLRPCVLLLALVLLASPLRAQTLGPVQIDQLLAPIALHPDPLLAQMLTASTYPRDVAEAATWRAQLPPGTSANQVAQEAWLRPWAPSVKSLTGFPSALMMLGELPQWTRDLGDAFLVQSADIFDGVQRLRARAMTAGGLRTNSRQAVIVDVGQPPPTIRILPANPGAVFVPTYDPNQVYGRWPYPAYSPTQWYPRGYPTLGMTLSFTAGLSSGDALWGVMDWHARRVLLNLDAYNAWNGTQLTEATWRHDPARRGDVPAPVAPIPVAVPPASEPPSRPSAAHAPGVRDRSQATPAPGAASSARAPRAGGLPVSDLRQVR